MNAGSPRPDAASVLAINAGSSTIRFALYDAGAATLRARGKIERIGSHDATLTAQSVAGRNAPACAIDGIDYASAAGALIDWLDQRRLLHFAKAVGHRVVHGGAQYGSPERIDDTLLQRLRTISDYSPEHLPSAIDLIERFRQRLPDIPHVACFDTAFHHDMPRVARLLPIPRRFEAKGIRRFGFHGLSYQFLIEELERVAGIDAARGRVILAHLGNGSSLAALRHGKSVDTSMAFTPAGGVPMSTRSGDLDPGLAWYFARAENIGTEQFHHMVNRESGLLGISETSADMRDLLALEATDVRAAEAVEFYCYQIAKCVGAFAAALGGLDTLVFAGGIGENAPVIRQRVCTRLEFLGVRIDPGRNASNDGVISSDGSAATVRMIRTDEELMIARAAQRLAIHA